MARHAEFEPLYKAFNDFVQLCLIEDKSLLWTNFSVWTPENIAEVKRRVVDNPLLTSDYSFVDKLLLQMKGATPEQWMVLADIYFVYYLPSETITPQKKRAGILWAIEQTGSSESYRSDNIWDALNSGIARTGQRYHMKYAQFWLILLLADNLKQHPQARRQEILKNASLLQHLLDSLLASLQRPADRANDMRRAILHLTFPEQYEPIISTGDREHIIQRYQPLLKAPVPQDEDQKLYLIRAAITSTKYKANKIPFKFDDLKEEWENFSAPLKDVEDIDQRPEKTSGTIFVSYRRADSGYIVDRIKDELVLAFGEENVFLDVDSIHLGVDFRNRLNEAINGSNVVLVVMGERWLDRKRERRLNEEGDFVRFEIATALKRGILVIPVFIENASISDTSRLPPDLESLAWLQGIHLRPYPDFKADMNTLIAKLETLL